MLTHNTNFVFYNSNFLSIVHTYMQPTSSRKVQYHPSLFCPTDPKFQHPEAIQILSELWMTFMESLSINQSISTEYCSPLPHVLLAPGSYHLKSEVIPACIDNNVTQSLQPLSRALVNMHVCGASALSPWCTVLHGIRSSSSTRNSRVYFHFLT